VTVLGADRPGLVQSISAAVAACGGNWLESRMARLAGQFAGILLIDLPAGADAALAAAVATLEAEGLRVVVQTGAVEAPAVAQTVMLEVVGQDRPGIIRDITAILARLGVNIDELSTDVQSGSFSGEAMFRAEARLRVPEGLAVEVLRGEVERLGNELMVDFSAGDAGR
jgi:glycine cleavage system regulatory protein